MREGNRKVILMMINHPIDRPFLFLKIYAVGTHSKCLSETLRMSTIPYIYVKKY